MKIVIWIAALATGDAIGGAEWWLRGGNPAKPKPVPVTVAQRTAEAEPQRPSGTITERAERNEIFRIAKGDPEMEAAFRKARATLPQFLALARAPRPTTTNFSIKVPIPYGDKGDAEFFWLAPFSERGGQFSGRINNTPRSATSVRLGQMITFKEDQIVDWLYMENGRIVGNFTACALLAREPREQAEAFMQKFGLNCDS